MFDHYCNIYTYSNLKPKEKLKIFKISNYNKYKVILMVIVIFFNKKKSFISNEYFKLNKKN